MIEAERTRVEQRERERERNKVRHTRMRQELWSVKRRETERDIDR